MKILIVGCGPGGERWREIEHDRLIAVNSAIADCAHEADVFLCVENLGEHPERDHPWIATPTKARRMINEQTLRQLEIVFPRMALPHFREETPMIYRDTSVGTALYHAVRFAEKMLDVEYDRIEDMLEPNPPAVPGLVFKQHDFEPTLEIHLIGFPLWFVDGVQHWTDTGDLYTPGASYWLPPIVFQSVNGMESTWAFIMATAYFWTVAWRYPIVNHGGGLLDVPGIELLWNFHEYLPFSCTIEQRRLDKLQPLPIPPANLQRIIDSAPMERMNAPRDHVLER